MLWNKTKRKRSDSNNFNLNVFYYTNRLNCVCNTGKQTIYRPLSILIRNLKIGWRQNFGSCKADFCSRVWTKSKGFLPRLVRILNHQPGANLQYALGLSLNPEKIPSCTCHLSPSFSNLHTGLERLFSSHATQARSLRVLDKTLLHSFFRATVVDYRELLTSNV